MGGPLSDGGRPWRRGSRVGTVAPGEGFLEAAAGLIGVAELVAPFVGDAGELVHGAEVGGGGEGGVDAHVLVEAVEGAAMAGEMGQMYL